MAFYPGYGPITPAQRQNIINQSTAVVRAPSHREANEARIRSARAGNATAAREIAQLRGDSRFNAGLQNYRPTQTRPAPSRPAPPPSAMRGGYSKTFSPNHPDLYREGHRLRRQMDNSENLSDREFAQVVGSYQNLSNAMYQGAMGQAAKVYGGPQGRGPIGPGKEWAKGMYGQHAQRYSNEMGERKGYIQAAQERRRNAAASREAKRMKDQADALAQRQAAARQAEQQRQQMIAQQGRNIGNFVHRAGTSPSPSQSYYRPPSRGMAPGASMFQQAMMRGFSPPAQNNRRQFGGYGYGAMQTRPQRGSPSNMPAYQRRQRASDVNAPVNYFDRSRGLSGRAMRGIQRQARRS